MALHYSLYGNSDDEDDPRPGTLYEDDEPQAIEEIVEGEIEPFNDAEGAGDSDDMEGLFGDSNAPTTDAEKKEVKEKKVHRKSTVPKLNSERLKGPGGLIAVDELFSDFKMLGRGHELDDLNQILKRFETWTHRMYPRFTFPDCIYQIERLGRKKDIKGFMLRSRNQQLLPVVDPIRQFDDDDDEADVDNPVPMQIGGDDPTPMRSDDDEPPPALTADKPPPALTADVLERMRQNREAALARRKEKMREREAGEMAASGGSVSNSMAVAAASPSDPGNEIIEDSVELETPMEVDQPLDEAVQAFSPEASPAVDESDRSLSQ